MQRNEQAYHFITYDDNRDMVVINKQPYYKSTGSNSGLRGTWFPFIMVGGTKIHHKFYDEIKYPIDCRNA